MFALRSSRATRAPAAAMLGRLTSTTPRTCAKSPSRHLPSGGAGVAAINPGMGARSAFHTTTRTMAATRTETDAFGEVQVAADKYWGAQTERSLTNFRINQPQDRMPPPIVRAFGILKGAAATVNMRYGLGMLVMARAV